MKLGHLALAIAALGAAVSVAHADPLEKKITLTAVINDAIFVSKPDGSTWYSTEALDAVDYKQEEFTKNLPVRVYSKNSEFNLSLSQPLRLSSNNGYTMRDPKVTFSDPSGDKEVQVTTPLKVTQTSMNGTAYDEVHDLKISVKAPVEANGVSTNGNYSGDLVMIFDPVASSGD